jgi:hypothetical protein
MKKRRKKKFFLEAEALSPRVPSPREVAERGSSRPPSARPSLPSDTQKQSKITDEKRVSDITGMSLEAANKAITDLAKTFSIGLTAFTGLAGRRKKAADQIIKQYQEEKKQEVPVDAPDVSMDTSTERESAPEFKIQKPVIEFKSIEQFEDEMHNSGRRALSLYGGVQLKELVSQQQDLQKETDEINKLIRQRDKLKQEKDVMKDRRTGKYRFPDKMRQNLFSSLEDQIREREIALSKKISTILKPEFDRLLALKDGVKTEVIKLYNKTWDSTQKEGTNLMVNVLLELQDEGKIEETKIKELVKHLKEKKLLENKRYIKLAKILF